jgi:hypothetical protein
MYDIIMFRYAQHTRSQIRSLRQAGLTYTEINERLGLSISKSSLAYICRGILLSEKQLDRNRHIMLTKVAINRKKALIANKDILDNRILSYRIKHLPLAPFINNNLQAKLIALAVLYLGEGAKWPGSRTLKLGSSDFKIIRLYMNLLEDCYGIKKDRLRFRIQHRADQSPSNLLEYWSNTLGIHKDQFYKSYVDKRTIGKITKKTGYHGVCTISGGGTDIQLELAQIADIIGESL